MSIASTAPSTVQVRRSRLLWLIVGVAAATAAITWAATTVATGGGHHAAAPSAPVRTPFTPSRTPKVPSIFDLTPARLAAGALGTGYQLPVKHTGPTVESVLASMSPQTRRWTKAVMALTFAQLAAGAAGSP